MGHHKQIPAPQLQFAPKWGRFTPKIRPYEEKSWPFSPSTGHNQAGPPLDKRCRSTDSAARHAPPPGHAPGGLVRGQAGVIRSSTRSFLPCLPRRSMAMKILYSTLNLAAKIVLSFAVTSSPDWISAVP
jgi:hypothetical protein